MTMEHPNHKALVQRAIARDGAAFDQLLAFHRPELVRYLTRLTRDPHMAEDLTQEVAMKVVLNINRYKEVGTFRAWLHALAHNAFVDHKRRPSNRLEGPTETAGADVTAPDEGVVRQAARPERTDLVRQALAGLEDREQQALRMWRFLEMKYEDIAVEFSRELGCTVPAATVRMWVCRAKKKLEKNASMVRAATGWTSLPYHD